MHLEPTAKSSLALGVAREGPDTTRLAYAAEGRNRCIGGPDYNATVNYLIDTLAATGYYDIEVQPFTVPSASADLTANGVAYTISPHDIHCRRYSFRLICSCYKHWM
jgi:hypothetical protein